MKIKLRNLVKYKLIYSYGTLPTSMRGVEVGPMSNSIYYLDIISSVNLIIRKYNQNSLFLWMAAMTNSAVLKAFAIDPLEK